MQIGFASRSSVEPEQAPGDIFAAQLQSLQSAHESGARYAASLPDILETPLAATFAIAVCRNLHTALEFVKGNLREIDEVLRPALRIPRTWSTSVNDQELLQVGAALKFTEERLRLLVGSCTWMLEGDGRQLLGQAFYSPPRGSAQEDKDQDSNKAAPPSMPPLVDLSGRAVGAVRGLVSSMSNFRNEITLLGLEIEMTATCIARGTTAQERLEMRKALAGLECRYESFFAEVLAADGPENYLAVGASGVDK